MKLPGALSRLDEAGYQTLQSLLALGKGDTDIAAAMQEKGLLADVKQESLRRAITRWRKGRGQELVIKELADRMTTEDGRLKKQIDVVEEMTTLIQKQKTRVQKVAKNEEASSALLLEMVSDEMKTLFAMLEKLGKLQLDTGLLRKVRVGETAQDYEESQQVEEAEFSVVEITEEERRLLEMARREVGE